MSDERGQQMVPGAAIPPRAAAPPPPPPPSSGLTRLTVNLTPSARDALGKAVALTGDDNTVTVCRALMLLGAVAEVASQHEGSYWVGYPDFDARGAVWLLVARERPKKRWWSR